MRSVKTIGVTLALVLAFSAGAVQAVNEVMASQGLAQGGSQWSLVLEYDGSSNNAFLTNSCPNVNGCPNDEARHLVELFLRLDTSNNGGGTAFTMAPGDKHQILQGRGTPSGGGSNTTVWRVHLRRQTGGAQAYVLALWARTDGGSFFVGEKLVTPDAWQRFTFDWSQPSMPGQGDGMAFINKGNGTPKGRSDLENNFVINAQRLGILAGPDAGTMGDAYVDNFDSRRAP